MSDNIEVVETEPIEELGEAINEMQTIKETETVLIAAIEAVSDDVEKADKADKPVMPAALSKDSPGEVSWVGEEKPEIPVLEETENKTEGKAESNDVEKTAGPARKPGKRHGRRKAKARAKQEAAPLKEATPVKKQSNKKQSGKESTARRIPKRGRRVSANVALPPREALAERYYDPGYWNYFYPPPPPHFPLRFNSSQLPKQRGRAFSESYLRGAAAAASLAYYGPNPFGSRGRGGRRGGRRGQRQSSRVQTEIPERPEEENKENGEPVSKVAKGKGKSGKGGKKRGRPDAAPLSTVEA